MQVEYEKKDQEKVFDVVSPGKPVANGGDEGDDDGQVEFIPRPRVGGHAIWRTGRICLGCVDLFVAFERPVRAVQLRRCPYMHACRVRLTLRSRETLEFCEAMIVSVCGRLFVE